MSATRPSLLSCCIAADIDASLSPALLPMEIYALTNVAPPLLLLAVELVVFAAVMTAAAAAHRACPPADFASTPPGLHTVARSIIARQTKCIDASVGRNGLLSHTGKNCKRLRFRVPGRGLG